MSLSDGVIAYAKTHEESKGAFLTFQKDADQSDQGMDDAERRTIYGIYLPLGYLRLVDGPS